MGELVETLARELERPREVTPQVARHLAGNYGITDDEIGRFLIETLPTLEEDEVDLILSPLFTPKLDDQAVAAAQLGAESVPEDAQQTLVAQLVSRPTDAAFVTSDGETHAHRLGEVTVERYVFRLRLEGTITASIFGLIRRFPDRDRGLLQAVARRAIWENGRSNILEGYLSAMRGLEDANANETRGLLDLVERYKPADIGELVAKIPRWREALRGDLGLASGGRPFFNERIEQSHGGEYDRRSPEDLERNSGRRNRSREHGPGSGPRRPAVSRNAGNVCASSVVLNSSPGLVGGDSLLPGGVFVDPGTERLRREIGMRFARSPLGSITFAPTPSIAASSISPTPPERGGSGRLSSC